ncbi:MAG: hypothetical protein IT318_23795 [Anaerolineales bacterium]|nr:hypothetical protein [Anaerolineales bacterium]
MNGTAVQAAVQTIIQNMSEFENADVTINDWRLLDQSTVSAPYVIITNPVDIDSSKDSSDTQDTYILPLILVEPFTEWKTTLDNLRNRMEAIFTAFNAIGTARSAGGIEGTNISRVRTDGPTTEYYGPGVDPQNIDEAMPIFLMQVIALFVEEF